MILVFDAASAENAGEYRCEVTDAVTTVTSPVVTLTVTAGLPVGGPVSLALAALALAMPGILVLRRRCCPDA